MSKTFYNMPHVKVEKHIIVNDKKVFDCLNVIAVECLIDETQLQVKHNNNNISFHIPSWGKKVNN